MGYSNDDIAKVREADIRDFIPGLTGSGHTQYCKCPSCGKEGKRQGLCVTHKGKLNLAKCFACGFSLADPIAAVQHYDGVDFPTAVKMVAERAGIFIETEQERRARSIRTHKKRIDKSFCAAQLEASGLTVDDVSAHVKLDNGEIFLPTFRRGGMDVNGLINETDDEMLVYYYDLQGYPMMYSKKGARTKQLPYVRIRWSNPAAHRGTDGRECKYKSPAGAPTRLYIPQYIRERYLNEEPIETLIVQEGEKKAEKACKHGIASVGIQGIFNIGNEETGLIQDLQYIVQTCKVKNVVLLFDSDWDHLSRNLQVGDHVDYRPNAFSKAAIKFKTYVQTLHGIGVSVDIYFGHINANERDGKGIDDLLVGTLKGQEDELLKDIKATMLTHDGKGRYVNIHKITSKTDNQIRDYWGLNDPSGFFDRYREQLLQLPNFRFARMAYRVDEGKILQASKTSERDFWRVVVPLEGDKKKRIEFDGFQAGEFISANGYYRIHTADLEPGQYDFVRIDEGIVHRSSATEIRDFIYYYILQSTKDPDVRSHFFSKLGQLLASDKLERIQSVADSFDTFEPYQQMMYFANGQVTITAEDVVHSKRILGQVWEDKVIPRHFRRVPVIKNISRYSNGDFSIELTPEGERCEFFQFIQNASNFWAREGYTLTEKDEEEFRQHIVNKVTSIGFLMLSYKHQTEQKAVIAMDGQLGEVAQSNGRTGKSLIGKALSFFLPQAYVDGRNTANDDKFIYSTVTLRTRNIFLDDVKVNFDFGKFFGALTGDLSVNVKGGARFIIKNERSPKFYITTNHAINVKGSSERDRIIYMAFSDWYSDTHSPIDDFGHAFFDEWDTEQWELFMNLMAECCMYYLRSLAEGWYRRGCGAVPPPMRDIKLRTFKQLMGEAFFQWAETYFDPSGPNLNCRQARKVMYDAFHAAFPGSTFGVTPASFRTKLENYCEFKGYHLNPQKLNKRGHNYASFRASYPEESFLGAPDKSGGTEYFSVFSQDFADRQPF